MKKCGLQSRIAKAAGRLLVSGFSICLSAAVLAAALMVLFGMGQNRFYAVMSGSMEPAIPAGSLVYVVPCPDPAQILPGDVIAFRAGSATAVHRVVSADRQNRCFRTKGDANTAQDPQPVPYARVLGIVRRHVPGLGYGLVFLRQRHVRLVLGAGAALAAAVSAAEVWMNKKNSRKKGIYDACIKEEQKERDPAGGADAFVQCRRRQRLHDGSGGGGQ